MNSLTAQGWHDYLVLTRTLTVAGDRSAFYAGVRRGEFVRLARGVYVPTATWTAADRHEKYRWSVRAAAATAERDLVVSHESAAALWRLPALGAWPTTVHEVTDAARGGRSTGLLTRHTSGIPHGLVRLEGIRATGLARTVVDVARTSSFAAGVVVADAALRRAAPPAPVVPAACITHEDLLQELGAIPIRQGSARALKTIEFADGRADRPGESISRVNMHLAGISPPQLQVRLYGASGRLYYVDFWWEGCSMIGEFDGQDKYSNPEFLRGRTPQQALLDEKYREDDLRAAGRGMSRWGWDIAVSQTRLRAHLFAAGIR